MKPYILLSLLTLLFALSAVDGLCQAKKEKLHRFYDFNVSIESRKSLYPIINRQKLKELDKESLKELYERSEWKYITQNVSSYFDEETGKESELKEDVLYFIQYLHFRETENSPVVREAADTLKIKLKKSQLDSVYNMAQQLFMLDDKPNLSPYEIPPPPVPDREWAHVDFDLGYRGNRYRVTIKQPRQKEYSKLYNYLDNIKKQSITTPVKN